MEVQLLRDPSGDVLFLEANAEFVDVLVKVFQAPFGSVLSACMSEGKQKCGVDNPKHALLNLALSVPRLRDAVFSGKKEDAIPSKISFGDLVPVDPTKRKPGTPPRHCLPCLKINGRVTAFTPGQCRHCNFTGLPHFSNVLQWAFCCKCVSQNGGIFQLAPNRTCSVCKTGQVRTCTHCDLCDACSLAELGYQIEGVPERVAQSAFKESAKFMVTNTLEVFEASPVKMVELMAGTVDSFKGMRTCTVLVTEDHIKQLLLRSLLGSTQVLSETFAHCDEKKDHEVASSLGSEGSFDLTCDIAEVPQMQIGTGSPRIRMVPSRSLV